MHGEVHKVRHDSRLANPTNRSDAQNVATFDSEMRFANLIGSMNDAFSELRSASVTPRATLQAPQTKTGTLPLILASSSGSGGKPKPWMFFATVSLTIKTASPTNAIVHSLSAPIDPTAVMNGSVALVGSSLACVAIARIFAITPPLRVN